MTGNNRRDRAQGRDPCFAAGQIVGSAKPIPLSTGRGSVFDLLPVPLTGSAPCIIVDFVRNRMRRCYLWRFALTTRRNAHVLHSKSVEENP